jgi:hypothetical protein
MNALVGQKVKLPNDCKCGADTAAMGASDGKYYATLTCSCGRGRGSLTEFTGKWIEAIAAKFGAPEIITIQAPRLSKAAAKQDEFLKKKFDAKGKSWFDIISETFDEIAPPSGTGQGNDDSTSAEN